MLKCEDQNGEYVHYMFDEVICWKGLHILHTIIGILAFLVYVIICLIISLCCFESRLSSLDPSARANSRNEFWTMIFKTVCNIMSVFFLGDDYRWVNVIVFGVGGIVLYIKQKAERSYYNEVINVLADVNNGLFIWSTFMLVVVMAAENTSFNGGIQAFLMGTPLIIIFLITKSDHRKDMLLKGIEGYDSGDQWYIKVRYYISFIQKKEMNRDTSVELKGYIYSHEEKCTMQNCPLRVYVSNVNNLIKDNKRKKQSKAATENFALLMRFANTLFLQGINKFPSCTSLRIAYAFFLKDRMNNRTLAVSELLSAEKYHPPFDEQFLIYRYRKLIEDEMADVQTDNQSGTLDAISMIAYDNYLRQFKEAIERSAYLHMEFWLEVLELEPDLGKLDKTGSKIHLSIVVVEDYWAKLQKINSNTPKALKIYAEFLIEILNDSEAGGELLSRAKDTVIARATFNANSLDAAEIMGMGDMCAGMGGADGTPCIIASGEQGKIGEMIQFNMAVCRTFGYTKAELNGRKISTLMPEMYAKYHDKILQKCINSNEDNTARADIFVLGKHKSGYLVPLFLQTRMLTSVTQGVLFAATLSPEKKGLNACYLLLNEQQDVVGVSSRCISMLQLSNRILKNLRVSFQTLAPSLQDKNTFEQYRPSNEGAMLEFFKPDVKGEEDEQVNRISKDDITLIDSQANDSPTRKLRVKASTESLNLSCIINDIVLLNEQVGYLVRLEPAEDGKELAYEKKIEKIHKYPNIQFAFDPVDMRFIQEDCEDDAQKLMADETFIHVNIMRDKSYSNVSPLKSEENHSPNTSMLSGVDEITRLQQLLRSKACGADVKTKRLINGEQEYIEARPRLLERQMEEQQELEEAKRRESRDDEKKEDIFQSSLKSKKAFNAALNEKSVPPSIKKLKYTGYIIGLAILTLISVEFALLITELKDIQDNIYMVKYSRKRIAIQMKMAYYINKIVLLKSADDPKYVIEESKKNEIILKSKDIISNALNDYYDVQNKITLSKLSLSEESKKLYTNKVVTLYYKGTASGYIQREYTLTEAIQQLASEVFTVHSFNVEENLYNIENDDIHFIMYNSFADLYSKMYYSSNCFVDELKDRGSSKKVMVYILYAVGLAVVIASAVFLFPVVSGVSKSRLEVLSLFLDIPQNSVRALEKKAEKFVAKSNNEAVDDAMSNEGEILTGNGLVLEGLEIEASRTGRHRRKFKNNTTSNTTFYLQYIFAMLVVAGYFSFNFAYGYIFLNTVSKYSRELNATTAIQTETSNSFSVYQNLLAYRRLLMYDNVTTFKYLALEKIPEMYSIASEVQNSHNDHQQSFKKKYQDTFIDIMRNNLCDYETELGLNIQECSTFLDGTLVEGLHPVIIHYIEQLREKLTSYRIYCDKEGESGFDINKTLTEKFLKDDDSLDNMEPTIFEVVELSIQYLVNSLVNSYTLQYDSEITKRIILFICFLVVLFIAFLVLWIPFTNRLNDEVKSLK